MLPLPVGREASPGVAAPPYVRHCPERTHHGRAEPHREEFWGWMDREHLNQVGIPQAQPGTNTAARRFYADPILLSDPIPPIGSPCRNANGDMPV
jgi:hypothetical protein